MSAHSTEKPFYAVFIKGFFAHSNIFLVQYFYVKGDMIVKKWQL